MKFIKRQAKARGNGSHGGWLESYFTFSFADYYDPKYTSFGNLRVLNEDYVEKENGFPLHPHNNYEIFSYVIDGELTHTDSINKKEEICKSGFVQFTSAGKGIYHSEINQSNKKKVHLLQIWVQPFKQNLEPQYHIKEFKDSEKKNKLCMVMKPSIEVIKQNGLEKMEFSKEAIEINSNFCAFSSKLEEKKSIEHNFPGIASHVYVHLVMNKESKEGTKLAIEANIKDDDKKDTEKIVLFSGDGLFIENEKGKEFSLKFSGISKDDCEFVVLQSNK